MIGYLRRLTIRNVVSPHGLALASYCVFLLAWTFPPGLYTEYLHEPDWMFLEPLSLLFYTACTAAFMLGVRASRFLGTPRYTGTAGGVSVRSPLTYLLPPLLFAASASAIYLVKMGGKINFVALLASQQGNTIKAVGGTGQMSEGRWDECVPLLTVVLWWSLFRALQLRLRGTAKAAFYILFCCSTALGIAVGIATVSRANLMPIVVGLFIIYQFPRTQKADTKVSKLALTGGLGSAGAVGVFLLFSFLRGTLGLNLLLSALLGYTIVSYNRMAAMLTGVMHYAYEGRGVYLSPFLLGDAKVDYLFHFADRFGWPTSIALWQTEFSSTSAAGLNPTYIWAGAFGYVYSDVGWFAPLYWGVVGVLAGFLWTRFTAGRAVGLVLYPWVAFSILMWCGPNFIFRTNFVQYCEFAVVLHLYDRLFLRRMHAGYYGSREERLPAVGAAFFGPMETGLDRGIF